MAAMHRQVVVNAKSAGRHQSGDLLPRLAWRQDFLLSLLVGQAVEIALRAYGAVG